MLKLHPCKAAREASQSPHPTDDPGFCLRQVRKCFKVSAKALDAAQAWRDAKFKQPQTHPDLIPRNVPVFWTGGQAGHGHIAISAGNGWCWSTDIERPGYFDRVPIDRIGDQWGLTLVGWTEDLNGVRVYQEPAK